MRKPTIVGKLELLEGQHLEVFHEHRYDAKHKSL